MHFDVCIQQASKFRRDICALFVDTEHVCANVEISRVHRNVLRRQTLFNYPAHLVFGDRRQRRVVARKKRKANVFVLNKQGRACICRIAVAETEDALIGALTWNDLLESEAEVFPFTAFEFYFPVVAALLAHLENELSFSGSLKTEIEIIANEAPVHFYYPVSGFEFHFRAETVWCYLTDFHPAAPNVCNCWRNCKLVH